MDQPGYFYSSQKLTPDKWVLGQVVLKKCHFPVSFTGTVGIVYQIESGKENSEAKPYVAIILDSGDDLNLMEAAQLEDVFVSIGQLSLEYQYEGPQQLMNDSRSGLFAPFFDLVKQYIDSKTRKAKTSVKTPKARNG